MSETRTSDKPDPERIAKVIARAGLCSRRDAETWIAAGRVSVNGSVLTTPAVTVGPGDVILVDGEPLPDRDRTRLWLFHKPRGTVTTNRDPEGRATVFDILPPGLPRVMTVGRLDINTEGLLILTNDGGLARVLELPKTGWLRRYRVRAHGDIDQPRLDALRDGIAIDGVLYGAIEATLDRRQGDNVWLTMGLREGKNREIKNILLHLGLDVNRLIRVSFGPFELGEMGVGKVEEVTRRMILEAIGPQLAEEAGVDLASRPEDRRPQMPERRSPAAGQPAIGRRPDARDNRLRHAADVEHDAQAREAAQRRPTLGLKGGARMTEDKPTGQKSRRDVLSKRKTAVTKATPVVERRSREEASGGGAATSLAKGRTGGSGGGKPLAQRDRQERKSAAPARAGEERRPSGKTAGGSGSTTLSRSRTSGAGGGKPQAGTRDAERRPATRGPEDRRPSGKAAGGTGSTTLSRSRTSGAGGGKPQSALRDAERRAPARGPADRPVSERAGGGSGSTTLTRSRSSGAGGGKPQSGMRSSERPPRERTDADRRPSGKTAGGSATTATTRSRTSGAGGGKPFAGKPAAERKPAGPARSADERRPSGKPAGGGRTSGSGTGKPTGKPPGRGPSSPKGPGKGSGHADRRR